MGHKKTKAHKGKSKRFIAKRRRRKSFKERLKPNELKIREEQMKQFRYQCARITGNILYFIGNLYISGVFIIFFTMWLSGMYDGTQIINTFKSSYRIWEDILSSCISLLTPISIMLVVSVKMLSYDAKGKFSKPMKIAMEKSMYFLILIMISISVLYFNHVHWHI